MVGRVMLLVTIQSVAAAAGVDLKTFLELYGSLAAIGLVPGLREPYSLAKRPPPR